MQGGSQSAAQPSLGSCLHAQAGQHDWHVWGLGPIAAGTHLHPATSLPACARRHCTFYAGLELDPNNAQIREALEDTKRAEAEGLGDAPSGGMNNMFGPAFLGKLALDPRTKHLLQQQDFLAMLQNLQRNPQSMQMYLQDQRFQLALQVGL